MEALPNNVYGKVETAPLPTVRVQSFAEYGWKARKSSTTDFEVECGWAAIEFACNCETEVGSFTGVIESNRMPELVTALSGMGMSSTIEPVRARHVPSRHPGRTLQVSCARHDRPHRAIPWYALASPTTTDGHRGTSCR